MNLGGLKRPGTAANTGVSTSRGRVAAPAYSHWDAGPVANILVRVSMNRLASYFTVLRLQMNAYLEDLLVPVLIWERAGQKRA